MKVSEKNNVVKSGIVVRTIYNNIMGLEKGSWLYYQPESDSYCLNVSRESTHNDIGYYHSKTSVDVTVSRDIVESLIGDLFEYVNDPFIMPTSGTDEKIKEVKPIKNDYNAE